MRRPSRSRPALFIPLLRSISEQDHHLIFERTNVGRVFDGMHLVGKGIKAEKLPKSWMVPVRGECGDWGVNTNGWLRWFSAGAEQDQLARHGMENSRPLSALLHLQIRQI